MSLIYYKGHCPTSTISRGLFERQHRKTANLQYYTFPPKRGIKTLIFIDLPSNINVSHNSYKLILLKNITRNGRRWRDFKED